MELKIDVDALVGKTVDKSLESLGIFEVDITQHSDGSKETMLGYVKDAYIKIDKSVLQEDNKIEVPAVVYDELQQARTVMGYYKHLIDKNVVSDLTEEESMVYEWIREDEERFFKAMVFGMKKKEQLYYIYIKEGMNGHQYLNKEVYSAINDFVFLSTRRNSREFQTIFTEEEIKALPKGHVWWEFRKPVEEVNNG